MIGRTILHYTITGELGAGAMGRVYLARDQRTDRKVALKFIAPEAAGDAAAVARLQREAGAAARLSHPNIVALHALEEAEGQAFLVEEYVEGETLARRLERGPLGPEETLRLAHALASALAHAHQHGVLHRDLKPANVLIAADGTFKVADFGIARLEGAPTLTTTGVLLGTLPYLAPERARGARGDARADLFALGAVLYEAMAGHRAFAGGSEAEVLYGLLNTEPRPPEVATASLLPLATLVMRLLAKEPADRPPSAEAVLEALEVMRPQAPAARVAAAEPRPRAWLAPVLGALALVLALGAVWWARGRAPSPSSEGGAVAVLSFDNVADPGDSARIGSITGNLLITALAQTPRLNVLSTQRVLDAVRQVGGRGAAPGRATALLVARRARAERIVTGSVLQLAPAIVMTAEVSDVRSGRVLYAERIEGSPGENVFQVVDALGARLLGRMARPAEAARVEPVERRTSADLEAQRLYAEGMERLSAGDFRAAESLLAAAVARDGSFAQAWYQLAIVRWWWNEGPAAREDIRRAREHGDHLTPVERQVIEGFADLVEGRRTDARLRFERLASLHPDEKLALYGLEESRYHANDFEGTVAVARQALALDPAFTLVARHLVDALGALGRYDEAQRTGEDILRRDPRNQLLTEGLAILAGRRLDLEAVLRLRRVSEDAGLRPSSISLAVLAVARDSTAVVPALLLGADTRPVMREQARLGTDYLVALRQGRFRAGARLAARAWRLSAGIDMHTPANIPWADGFFAAIHAGDSTSALAFADSLSRRVGVSGLIIEPVYRGLARGLAYLELGDLPAARLELRRAEGRAGRDAIAAGAVALGRARLLEAEGRDAEALAQLRKALWMGWFELEPSMLVLQRARILVKSRPDAATLAVLDSLVRCPLVMPDEAVRLRLWRAQVLERLDRRAEAIAECREFLRIWKDADPGTPEVAQARALLARLARTGPVAARAARRT